MSQALRIKFTDFARSGNGWTMGHVRDSRVGVSLERYAPVFSLRRLSQRMRAEVEVEYFSMAISSTGVQVVEALIGFVCHCWIIRYHCFGRCIPGLEVLAEDK